MSSANPRRELVVTTLLKKHNDVKWLAKVSQIWEELVSSSSVWGSSRMQVVREQ